MRYRDKNDINYFKFLEATKDIKEDSDPQQVIEDAYNVFKPKNLNRFIVALEKEGRLKSRFKIDLDFKEAGRFIDADTYRGDGDKLNMLKCILVPKRKFWTPWKKHKVQELSLREAQYVLREWHAFLEDVKIRYEYIYNPPVRAQVGETTQGSIERQEFADHYGGYAEMVYLIACATNRDFQEVFKDELNYFLFWGEYLLRKRDVERLK
jgi:hypothetical protein